MKVDYEIAFVDAVPNAGAVSYIAREYAKQAKLEFIAPISRQYDRGRGYEFQNYETKPVGEKFLLFDAGSVSVCEVTKEPGAGCKHYKILHKLED